MLTHHNTKISIYFLGFRDGTTLQYVFLMYRVQIKLLSSMDKKKLCLMQAKESNHNVGQVG